MVVVPEVTELESRDCRMDQRTYQSEGLGRTICLMAVMTSLLQSHRVGPDGLRDEIAHPLVAL